MLIQIKLTSTLQILMIDSINQKKPGQKTSTDDQNDNCIINGRIGGWSEPPFWHDITKHNKLQALEIAGGIRKAVYHYGVAKKHKGKPIVHTGTAKGQCGLFLDSLHFLKKLEGFSPLPVSAVRSLPIQMFFIFMTVFKLFSF